ncbi:hypothetical protein CLU79DRAFT_740076 [Phycomyces nitens]|nr:hypothetical protein CLU79DRAFT_740076 [Phycomyces nitens]
MSQQVFSINENIPVPNSSSKRAYSALNASGARYTNAQLLIIIRLYGEFHRASTTRWRAQESQRTQLSTADWKGLADKYNDQTQSNKSPKALYDKWFTLKKRYMNQNKEMKRGGHQSTPDEIYKAINEILKDDPPKRPPKIRCSANEQTRRDDDSQTEESLGSFGQKRKREDENSVLVDLHKLREERREFLGELEALGKSFLGELREIMRVPESEERKEESRQIISLLKRLSEKLGE